MKQSLQDLLAETIEILKSSGDIPESALAEIRVDRNKDKAHGDFASNIAMVLCKTCGLAPRALAEKIVAALPERQFIKKTEIAGPGFINFFIQQDEMSSVIETVFKQGAAFGKSAQGAGQNVLIEFVSANPTGPLHVGHGRSAAFGASLANLLTAAGYEVKREYYVNDAGRQMDILAVSVWLRYLAHCGVELTFPVNAYRGDYVFEIAKALHVTYAGKFMLDKSRIFEGLPADAPEGDKELYIDAFIQRAKEVLGEASFSLIHQFALTAVLDDIKDDLAEFSVHYDNWFSERSLFEDGSLKKGVQALIDAGHTYKEEGALWFKSTDFDDEKDRVLVRANGQSTYFASDVAYHWNKYDRGYDRVIDILGADHHGYVARVKAAVRALGHDDNAIDVHLVQFAILFRGTERVQMSTRSGSFVTLRELRDEVGNDAARFFYVSRKPEQHMDFDLDIAKSQSNDNPVYYVQYAHARICSVMKQLKERGMRWDVAQGLRNVDLLSAEQEVKLIHLIHQYPELIEQAARTCQPHQLTYYLRELANALHSYYNAIVLLCDLEDLRAARLCLLSAVRQVIANCLEILGVSAPETM